MFAVCRYILLNGIFGYFQRELSNSKTQIVGHVALNTSVTDSILRGVGQSLYGAVDSKNCLDVDPSCVSLQNQTYIGSMGDLSK